MNAASDLKKLTFLVQRMRYDTLYDFDFIPSRHDILCQARTKAQAFSCSRLDEFEESKE